MADVPVSPNDPAFWMHHAFVDHVWQKFRQMKTADLVGTFKNQEYPPVEQSCSTYHYAEAQMQPFNVTKRSLNPFWIISSNKDLPELFLAEKHRRHVRKIH